MTLSDQTRWTPGDTLATLRRMGDRPAVLSVSGEDVSTMTGAGLADLIEGTVGLLHRQGIGRGDVVAIYAPNSVGWIAAGLACMHISAILAPIDAMAPFQEAREQIVRSAAKLIFSEAAVQKSLDMDIPIIALPNLPVSGAETTDASIGADDPVALFRTSGTTGKPKSFHLSLGNIGAVVRAAIQTGQLTVVDRVLMPLPMHHVYPWITATLGCLTVGATLVLPESPTGPHIASALQLTRPTVLIGVPRLYQALLDGVRTRIRRAGLPAAWAFEMALALTVRLRRITGDRFGSVLLAPVRRSIAHELRLMISGGAHLPVETAEELEALGWDLRSGYGLAETAGAFAAPIEVKRPGSVGRPMAGGELRIDTPNAAGVGEILLRGPTVFSGYIDNPEASASAFTADGFFRTGDLGRLDADGFLYVTGRAKEVIVLAGGDNLYPEDVEAKYLIHPQIGEIGVMEKDGALAALIIPNTSEIVKVGTMNPEEAIRIAISSVSKSLPATWRLAGFALAREPLPRTHLGKLRRFRLAELYDQAKAGGAATTARPLTAEERAWVEVPPRAAVWALLRREHGSRPFDLDTHLQLDLGLDSFGWMTLAVGIEDATGIRLEASDAAMMTTVRELLDRISERATEPGHKGPALEERLDNDRRKWLAPRNWPERVFGAVTLAFNRMLMQLMFRLQVEGAEGLPVGPVLICPNHISDLDPLAVGAALPRRVLERTFWAADKVRVFSSAPMRALARATRVFPVDETAPTIAVDLAVEALRQGSAQVWFPEGWRSANGRLLMFHVGVGRIIDMSRAPVVPVFISGALEAWPRERRFPRPRRVRVVFGAPIPAEDLLAEVPPGQDRFNRIAAMLRDRVVALARENGVDVG